MFKTPFLLSAAVLITACTPTQDEAPATCPKAQFKELIGTDINSAIFPLSLTYRTIYPDDAVTMDLMPERLNVQLDENGIITGLTCG